MFVVWYYVLEGNSNGLESKGTYRQIYCSQSTGVVLSFDPRHLTRARIATTSAVLRGALKIGVFKACPELNSTEKATSRLTLD